MDLVLPMAVLIFLTFGVLTFMFFARMKAIKDKKMKIGYMKIYHNKSDQEIPEVLIRYQRNFTNLFEVPLIFYCTCLVYMFLNLTDTFAIIMAWVFVLSRIFHSIVHLTTNHLLSRALSYAAGCLTLLVMWITLLGKIYL